MGKIRLINVRSTLFSMVVLLLAFGCTFYSRSSHPIVPTATPAISARTLASTNNFPWQERWRASMIALDSAFNYRTNIRNLIPVENGVIFADNPTRTGWDASLKFATSDQGDLQWQTEFNGSIGSMVADKDLVYVVGWQDEGITVSAFNYITGEIAWRSQSILPDHRNYYTHLQDNELHIYSSDGVIYIYEPTTGRLMNKLRPTLSGQEPSVLLFRDNRDLLYTNGNGNLALTRAGEMIWEINLGNRPQPFAMIYKDSQVITVKDTENQLFDTLVSIDIGTGNIVWERANLLYANFVIVDDVLYTISKDAEILLIDPQTGQTLGQAQLLPNTVNTSYPVAAVAVNKDMLYVYFLDSQELIAFEKSQE